MNKKKQKEQNTIRPVQRESISEVRGEEDFVEFLRRELGWPIPYNILKLSDVAIPHDLQRDFGFDPSEDRIGVSRLLNLAEDQPWGVFLFEFKTKKPQLSHLRKILRVIGSKKTLLRGDPIWDREDLLFICTSDWSQFQFVHFSGKKAESAVISSFGWKGPDDPFLHTLCKHNLPRLRMPTPDADGNFITDLWRETWKEAFNIKPVTDEFYATLKEVFDAVQAGITGLDGEERRLFAELVVNRLIFLKFVEKKGWLNDDRDYLNSKFRAYGKSDFWGNFLCFLFFEGLCQEPANRSQRANEILGEVPFLNAELFSPSEKWNDWEIRVNNRAFDLLFDKLLNPYNFTVCETSPLDLEVAFNQDLLGYGYEELIADQHGQGAYYTHPTEVNLMCRQSLWAYLENRCPEVSKDNIGRLLYSELDEEHSISLDHALLLYKTLHEVTVVDPALGSGTFPVAMMKHLFLAQTTLGGILSGYPEYESFISQGSLTDHRDAFALKLHIIERSIYGCDIDYFAVQIAKLRFWIELMVDCEHPEALPNFDCKLVVGDALVSVVGTDSQGKLITLEDHLGHPTKSSGQGDILHSIGKLAIEELGQLKHEYFNAKSVANRQILEKQIKCKQQELLLSVGVELDRITTTDKHIHWQIDFAEIFSGDKPGFDIAIANPPYLRQEIIDQSFAQLNLNITKNDVRDIYNNSIEETIDGKADLFIFFYFRAFMLIKAQYGIHCFICSNSWLDDDFGGCLQLYTAKNCSKGIIINNPIDRSFDSADVNAIISIFHSSNLSDNGIKLYFDADGMFFNKRHAELFAQDTVDKLMNSDIEPKELDELLPINTLDNDRVKNGKWGARFLRMPKEISDMLNNNGQVFVTLGSLCHFEYGSKPGIVDFFILSDSEIRSFNIESDYLCPILTSTKEIESLIIDVNRINKKAFVCSVSKEELQSKNHLGALEYINWGEKQVTKKKASHSKSEVTWPKVSSVVGNRPFWYSFCLKEPGDFIVPALVRERFFFAYNDQKAYDTNMFYHGRFQNQNDIDITNAILNSTLTYLMVEIYGRLNIGGRLNLYGTEYKQLPITNPKLLCSVDKSNILKQFAYLCKRSTYPINKELEQEDRIAFDSTIIASYGLSNIVSIDLIYSKLLELVNNRLAREMDGDLLC